MTLETLVVSETETLVITESSVEILDTTEAAELLEVAKQGPPGPPGAAGGASIEFPFAWGDASPRTVTVAGSAKLVYAVDIHISEAFDGTAPALTVGDGGSPARLMTATQNDPGAIGSYTSAPDHRYGTNTSIILTITPGVGATAGAGLLTLSVEQ